MNTKTLRGILLYSLIIIATIIVVFGIIIALMFIFPNLKLFGYGMISNMSNKTAETGAIKNISTNQTYDLTINVDNFNLSIVGEDTTDITYSVYNKCVGATNIFNTSIIKKETNSSCSITLVEPSGIIFYKDSNMIVTVPKNIQYNLTIKSSNGDISTQNIFNINNLNITTSNGDFSLANEEQTSLNLNSLYISTNKGKFNFKDNFEIVTITKPLIINSNMGNFYFNNLNADVKINSNDIFFEATNLTTSTKGFESNTQNIVLKIYDKLLSSTQNSILSYTSLININELSGTTSVISSYGGINVGTVNSKCIIESNDGDVSIKKATEYIKVKTSFGNINVENYEKSGTFFSKSGNITCNSTSSDFTNSTEITTTSGNITHQSNIVPFNIKATGSISIYVKLSNICNSESKNYTIDAENSTIKMDITNKSYAKYQVKGSINSKTGDILISNSETPIIQPESGFSGNENNLSLIKINCNNIVFSSIS